MQKDTEELNHELAEADGVEGFLEENRESFRQYTLQEYLAFLMDQKQMTKTEVIAKSHLEQIYAYHIIRRTKEKSLPQQDPCTGACHGADRGGSPEASLLRRK